MARVLFTWELGEGLGHIAPLPALCDHLAGHRVYAAVRDLAQVQTLVGERAVTLLQAPFFHAAPRRPIAETWGYAQMLHNCGFGEPGTLRGLVRAWRAMFDLVVPDLVVFDHSPTALLAARGASFARALLGSGFMCPPPAQPLGEFFPLRAPVQHDALRRDEARVLASANRVLDAEGLAPLASLGELYGGADRVLLTTFAELDHFAPRAAADYLGVRAPPAGVAPDWPAGEGRRIYAYLKPFARLETLLEALRRSAQPVLVYGNDVPQRVCQRYACDTLSVSEAPLDIARVAETCAFAVLNANHDTCAQLLLAAVPVLNIPLHREQQLFAERAAATGACLTAPADDADAIVAALNRLAEEDGLAAAAREFSVRHCGHEPAQVAARLAGELLALVRPGRASA